MFERDAFVVHAEVHIVDIEPAISRTLELPMDLNLAQLHEVLQAAFGWTDSHLHQFNIGGLTYSAPEYDEGSSSRRTFEASEVRLADFSFVYNTPILIFYEYDFGDNWKHAVSLASKPSEAGIKYPRCINGSRAGPPEDVGGSFGYADFLVAWRDPLNDRHKNMRRWVGRRYDPERFDLDKTNKAISCAMQRSRGSYRFRHEA
jgi:Plasmid pRiA4b ORF-3-like protein